MLEIKVIVAYFPGNIETVLLKLGTRNEHHKNNQMTHSAIVMEILLVPVSVKNQISLFSTSLSRTEDSAWKRY